MIKIATPNDTRILAELAIQMWSNHTVSELDEDFVEIVNNNDAVCFLKYVDDVPVGFAGCSADCETMYQIGVDVLPEYRRKGIASAITSRLAIETLKLGKVPFYCAAWSNIKSVRNAIRSGFRPAWVELTARNSEFVDDMNK